MAVKILGGFPWLPTFILYSQGICGPRWGRSIPIRILEILIPPFWMLRPYNRSFRSQGLLFDRRSKGASDPLQPDHRAAFNSCQNQLSLVYSRTCYGANPLNDVQGLKQSSSNFMMFRRPALQYRGHYNVILGPMAGMESCPTISVL